MACASGLDGETHMHGLIFAELKKYVVARLGPEAWNKLLDEANMKSALFLPNQTYPDAQLVTLVATASKITGKPADALLEDFGEFVAPDLLKLYAGQVNPAWRTLDLLEHTEESIHRVVRLRDPGAKPPELKTVRMGPNQLKIIYASPRKLCRVARGIASGVAKHYGEKVNITDAACTTKGAPVCEIVVEKV